MLPFPIISNTAIQPAKPTIVKLGSSSGGLLILYSNGELYCLGSQVFGTFGLGDTAARTTWTLCNTNVANFYSSYYNTLVIKNDDTYWWAGIQATFSATGNSYNTFWTQQMTIGTVLTPGQIKDIQIGQYGVLLLDTSNNMYVMGYNIDGVLGTGSDNTRNPTPILSKTGVQKISLTSRTSAYIGSDNRLYVSGYNGNGQLGMNNTTSISTWTLVSQGVAGTYTTVLDVQCTDSNIRVMAKTSSSKVILMAAGAAVYVGNGATTGNQQTFVVVNAFSTGGGSSTPITMFKTEQSTNTMSIISTSTTYNGILSVGNGNSGGLGNGTSSTIYSYTAQSIGIPTPASYGDFHYPVKMITGMMFLYNNKVYGSGTVFTPSTTSFNILTDIPYYQS